MNEHFWFLLPWLLFSSQDSRAPLSVCLPSACLSLCMPVQQPDDVQMYLLRSIFCKNKQENNFIHGDMGGRRPSSLLGFTFSGVCRGEIVEKPVWRRSTPPPLKHTRTKRLHERHSLCYGTAVHVSKSTSLHYAITVTYGGDTNKHDNGLNEWTNNV